MSLSLNFTEAVSRKQPEAASGYARPKGLGRQGLFISPESRLKAKASRRAAWALFWRGIGMFITAVALVLSLLSLALS
jgi:hypothetical protein